MKLQGSYPFPVSPETLWPLLIDPAILTAVIPGCQNITAIDENQFQGELTIAVGPMAGSYTGNLSLSHIVENEGFTFTFTAQSKRGTLGGNGRLHLQAQENSTLLTYEGEAKVGGQLASQAAPLLETNARALIRHSLENLNTYTQQGELPPKSPTSELQNELDPPSGNIFGGQQTTILVITAITAVVLFFLFYFFTRKPTEDS